MPRDQMKNKTKKYLQFIHEHTQRSKQKLTNHHLFIYHHKKYYHKNSYFFANFNTIPLRCFSADETAGDAGPDPVPGCTLFTSFTVQFTSGVTGLISGVGKGEFRGELVETCEREGDLVKNEDFDATDLSHKGDAGSLIASNFLVSISPKGNLLNVHGNSLSSSIQGVMLMDLFQ